MPVLIKTVDQVMRERQTDVYFLHFDRFARGYDAEVRRQLEWLIAHGVGYEMAAPEGWLEGDPGCYAIYFEGRDDPHLPAYMAIFENPSGGSLHPDLYQMYLVLFEHWAKRN